MTKGFLFFASMMLVIAACTTSKTPTAPTSAQSGMSGPLAHLGHGAAPSGTAAADPANSAAHDDKGYIDGWFNGEDVQLYYTKSFFCDPLAPARPSHARLEPRRTRRRGQARSRQSTPSLPHRRSRISSIRRLSPAAPVHRASITP